MTLLAPTIYQQQLDDLFEKISLFSNDLELQSHWAKYLCVLVSGYLEISVSAIYWEYAKNMSAPNVANFIDTHLKNFQNPNMEKILNLTRQFSQDWADSLQGNIQGEIKDSIDSIVANRHNIVHGRSVGITYARIKCYYKNAIRLICLIAKQCNV